jgi:hypothetical protein
MQPYTISDWLMKVLKWHSIQIDDNMPLVWID